MGPQKRNATKVLQMIHWASRRISVADAATLLERTLESKKLCLRMNFRLFSKYTRTEEKHVFVAGTDTC